MTEPDLTKVTEIFLVPSSFIVAALGTADTNPHRAAVSLLGLVVSALWLVCSRESFLKIEQPARRTRILAWALPGVFIFGWAWGLVIHLWLWRVAGP